MENDLLLTKDGSIGKLAIVKDIPYKASVNSGVFVTRPLNNDYDTNYMFYLLSSDLFKEFINYQKTGTTINHLYQEVFENFEYCYPPSIEEQHTIANFLDYKTSQIDELIEKKGQLLKLLEEKRIALITQAVTKVRNRDEHKRNIEVEVKNLDELREALKLNVGQIMLDNMTLEEMRDAVALTAGRIPLEASGNVNLDNVASIAETGVDFISVGMLTHSVKALDISLLLN